MYHIKEDLRTKKSADLMYNSLINIIKVKSFDKISISDISKDSTVSRATFYRNFDNIADILYWKFNEILKEHINKAIMENPNLPQPDKLINYVLKFSMNNSEIIEILINEGKVDIIYNAFLNNAKTILDSIGNTLEIGELEYRYFVFTRIGIFIGVFQAWVYGGKNESLDELTEILNNQIMFMEKTRMIF